MWAQYLDGLNFAKLRYEATGVELYEMFAHGGTAGTPSTLRMIHRGEMVPSF